MALLIKHERNTVKMGTPCILMTRSNAFICVYHVPNKVEWLGKKRGMNGENAHTVDMLGDLDKAVGRHALLPPDPPGLEERIGDNSRRRGRKRWYWGSVGSSQGGKQQEIVYDVVSAVA